MPLQARRRVARANALGGQALAAAHEREVVDERAGEARRRVAARDGPRARRSSRWRRASGRASRCAQASVSANVGVSATAATSSSTSCSPIGSSPAQSASLSISFASWWKSSPTRWISAAHASGSARAPAWRKRSATQLVDVPLRDLEGEHLAGLRARLRQRRVLLQLLGDERQHRAGRRRGEVRLDRLHVGDLPAVREPALGVPAAVDALDDDEPARRRRGCRRCRAPRPLRRTPPAPRRAPRPRARSGAGAGRAPSRSSGDRCR